MAADPARRKATYQDVLDAPDHVVAEILDGDLYTHPRPAGPHTEAASVLGMDLGGAFHRGRGGPGGWIILDEPELHLASDVIVPDLGGWRRERLAAVPDAAAIELPSDWACEVLSSSMRSSTASSSCPSTRASRCATCGWSIRSRAVSRSFGSTATAIV